MLGNIKLVGGLLARGMLAAKAKQTKSGIFLSSMASDMFGINGYQWFLFGRILFQKTNSLFQRSSSHSCPSSRFINLRGICLAGGHCDSGGTPFKSNCRGWLKLPIRFLWRVLQHWFNVHMGCSFLVAGYTSVFTFPARLGFWLLVRPTFVLSWQWPLHRASTNKHRPRIVWIRQLPVNSMHFYHVIDAHGFIVR